MVTAVARFIHHYSLLVIGAWLLAAVAANIFAPPLEYVAAAHDQSFLPSGTPSWFAVQRTAAAFSEVPTDNIAYLVLERNEPLNDADRGFYDQLIAVLRGDSRHVIELVDWWSASATTDAAVSNDHHAVMAAMRLSGMLGTSQASDSIAATRGILARLHGPDGLHTFITGPGAALVDESAAIDRQALAITAGALAALLVLLLIAYRSVSTALVSLISVGLALAVARPIVAVLGAHNLIGLIRVIGVSLFSVAVGAMVTLGTGTGFVAFLIGRYHERRREDIPSTVALADACRAVTPVIVGSALISMAALGSLSFSRITMFRNIGTPCAIGVFVAALVALTFTPALIAIADRADLLRPRRQGEAAKWRRIGAAVTRSPGSFLVGGATLIFVLAIPLPGIRFGWAAATAASAGAESISGSKAVDRHFPGNQLLPDIVMVETDHDIRNPTGLMAIEQITGALMTIPGVHMVQSASRLNGAVPKQATLTVPAVALGDRLEEVSAQLATQPTTFTDLDIALDEMVSALDELQDGMQNGDSGLGQVSSAARRLQGSITKLRTSVNTVSDILRPLPDAISEVPVCMESSVCSAVQDVLQWAGVVLSSSAKLANGVGHLADGIAASTQALAGLPIPVAVNFNGFASDVQGVRAAAVSVKGLVNSFGTPIRDLPGYFHNLAAMFHGSPGMGLNVSLKALTDSNMNRVLDGFFSPSRCATLLFVYGDGEHWAGEGAKRTPIIMAAIAGATKKSTLTPTSIELTGVGPAMRDVQALEGNDVILLGGITLIIIFTIVSLLLKSPVGGLVVIGTVVTSYASALGASVKIWQYLLGYALHWSVPVISFLVLVAVGSSYNLQLVLRIREELTAGPRGAIIRAFAATGGVGVATGITFAVMMFALGAYSTLSVAQIGVTVGVGLLVDTLVVQTFLLPAMMVLLGPWFWWPWLFREQPTGASRFGRLKCPLGCSSTRRPTPRRLE